MKCTNCGKCCMEEVCKIGEEIFETVTAPCPGLQQKDNKYLCGVVLHGDILKKGISKEITKLLGIGKGCDASWAM